MMRIFVLSLFALNLLVSCASHVSSVPYQPATKPENIEFTHDRLDVYPDDVRRDLAAHTNDPVAWVGIIRSTDAYEEDQGDLILANTVFEHHFFNWIQNGHGHGAKLYVSPRGEGLFRTQWRLKKLGEEGSARNAEKYAGKGKLAIFYGVPESVDTNGTVVLRYRYLRILDADHFSTNRFDYGRTVKRHGAFQGSSSTNSPP